MSESTTIMITLGSNDGVVFVVPETVAKQSQVLSHAIDDPNQRAYYNNSIMLHNITAPILEKVIEYCSKHADAAAASKTEMTEEGSSTTTASSRISDEELRNWDKQFVDVDPAMLFDLTMAADFLKIEGLQEVLKIKVAETSKMIMLGSNDGEVFLVPETVAKQSQVLSHAIDDPNQRAYYNNSIMLHNVTAPILAKVIKYCSKHADAAVALKTEMTEEGSSTTTTSSRISDEELRNWDKQFVDVDPAMLLDLTMAADFLKIEGLQDVLKKKVADTSKMITLVSNDGVVFEVPETVVKQSQVLHHAIDNPNQRAYYNDSILLPNFTASVVAKVIEYCSKHAEAAVGSKTEITKEGSCTTTASSRISDEELRNWDKQFVDVDPAMLFYLTMAADLLKIDGLQDVLKKNGVDTSKMITLKSNDGVLFLVPEKVAKQSQVLRHLINDRDPNQRAYYNNCISISEVSAPILAKVIEYCRKHVDGADASKTEMTKKGSSSTPASSRISDEDLRKWDKQFVDVDPATLFDLTMAADYLKIKGLQDVLTKKNFDNIVGDSAEKFRNFMPKWLYPK